jgi:hypothetical protein
MFINDNCFAFFGIMRKAPILYQSLAPVQSIPEMLNSLLNESIDVLILGAYCSGTVGRIYHPVIKKATQMKIPVFSIRQSMTDKWLTEWSNEEILPGLYEDEAETIGIGLIPLQKDLVKRDEVIKGIRKIADQTSDYHEIIRTAMKTYSSDKFNKRLNEIRAEYHLEPISY